MVTFPAKDDKLESPKIENDKELDASGSFF
jgi:hypothetical protein